MIEVVPGFKYAARSDIVLPLRRSPQDKEQEAECNAQNKFE
jgi:hypothetical protein